MDKIVVFSNQQLTPELKKAKTDYIQLRGSIHQQKYGEKARYSYEEDEWDKKRETVFVLALNNDQVIAGGRYTISSPAERTRLRFESPSDEAKIENLLPHVDHNRLVYAELGGVVAESSHSPIGLLLQEAALNRYKIGEIPGNIDVVVGRISPRNALVAVRAALQGGLNGVIRKDIKIEVEGNPRVIMMCARDDNFPLVTQEMIDRGAISNAPQGVARHMFR